jgi:hypothetical protein
MSDPIHSIARTVTAGGIVEYPAEAEPLYDHLGETLEAGDGTPTSVWASTKRRWRLVWNSPRPEIVERWRVRYTARATFTFVDPLGASYTAQIPVPGFSWKAKFEPSSGTASGTTYTLTVEIWES